MKGEIIVHVKKFRMEQGLTQEELAHEVGVSRQSINSIEQGRYIPSLPPALKFAEFFRCSTDELFQLKKKKRNG
jgi:putative transcriptional regulator